MVSTHSVFLAHVSFRHACMADVKQVQVFLWIAPLVHERHGALSYLHPDLQHYDGSSNACWYSKSFIYFQFMKLNYLMFHSPLKCYKSIHVLTTFRHSQLFLTSTSDLFWQLEENRTAAPSLRVSSRLHPVTCAAAEPLLALSQGTGAPHEGRPARGPPCRNRPL